MEGYRGTAEIGMIAKEHHYRSMLLRGEQGGWASLKQG